MDESEVAGTWHESTETVGDGQKCRGGWSRMKLLFFSTALTERNEGEIKALSLDLNPVNRGKNFRSKQINQPD